MDQNTQHNPADAALAILAGTGPSERRDAMLSAADDMDRAIETFEIGLARWARGEA